MGKVPNAYLTIGGHSPAALQQALAHNAMLHKGSLSAQQLEAINLSVSEATGCDYCPGRAHPDGEKAGFSSEQIHALRRGEYAEETQLDALVKFAQTLGDHHRYAAGSRRRRAAQRRF